MQQRRRKKWTLECWAGCFGEEKKIDGAVATGWVFELPLIMSVGTMASRVV